MIASSSAAWLVVRSSRGPPGAGARPRGPQPPTRLDQPKDERRVTIRPTYDAEAFGRSVERIARFLGTGRFLVYQTAFITFWILINVTPARFDKYPFGFLTLVLSLQAAYAAPLILLAQNRQDDRDRVNMEQDRRASAQQGSDTEFLARELAAVRIALGDVVTRDFLRTELRVILEELEVAPDEVAKKDKQKKKVKKGAHDEPALLSEPQRGGVEDPPSVAPVGPEDGH